MTNNSTLQRKKTRFFSHGKSKVGDLISRPIGRRERKTARASTISDDVQESDAEDDVPILSRINDPARFAQSQIAVAREDVQTGSNSTNTTDDPMDMEQNSTIRPDNVIPTTSKIDVAQDEGIVDAMTKKKRRQGIVGVEQLVDESPMSGVGSVGQETGRNGGADIQQGPGTGMPTSRFTLSSLKQLSPLDFIKAHPPAPPTVSQLSQAAANTFAQSASGFPSTITQRLPTIGPEYMVQSVKSFNGLNIKAFSSNGLFGAKGIRADSSTSGDAVKSSKLDVLKRSNSTAPAEKKASQIELLPVDNISSFIKSNVITPKIPSGLIRSAPVQSDLTLTNYSSQGLSDGIEARQFVQAAQPTLPTVTADGDAPALTSRKTLRQPPSQRELPRSIIQNIPNRGITNLPLHATERIASRGRQALRPAGVNVAENAHTSPDRLAKAYLGVRQSLKRKRHEPTLPPPSFTHHHTGDADFNIFQHGFLLYPELCVHLASHMTVASLEALYSISRDFHTIIDSRFTTVMVAQATRKAHESTHVFPFRCYGHLCRTDPSARNAHPNPKWAAKGYLRSVPSFRWLKFVIHREKTIQEILAIFAERGCPLPTRCTLAMKRMWFLFDIPDNARRIGYIHSPSLFTDLDLYFSMCFIVKLDMMCNDPVAPEKRDGLRKMLLSSIDGFSLILKVLRRETWAKQIDFLQAWIRYGGFQVPALTPEERQKTKHVFGVPLADVGALKKEFWGFRRGTPDRPIGLLLRPDQLIMREAIKRGFRFSKHFLRCVLYGYVRPDTLDSYDPRGYGRRIEGMEEDEYGVDDLIGGVRALAVKDGGDTLLDLGGTWTGSKWCIVSEKIPVHEDNLRQRESELKARYMAAWKQETDRR